MAKKPIRAENYLDRVPCRNPELGFTTDDEGLVTLLVEWKGFYYRLSQKLFHKPRVSQIHMDAYGSFLWSQIDGKKDVMELVNAFDQQFDSPEKSMARVIKFLETMKEEKFIYYRGMEK